MQILVIGCGRTGESITENLISLEYVNRIYLFNRTTKSAKEFAKRTDSKKIEVLEKLNDLPKLDYIIITLSGMSDNARREVIAKAKSSYEIRQSELKFNLGAVAHLINALNELPNKTKIIIVTNPVDEITNYLQTKLSKKEVIGFGADLDAKRYENLLGKKVLCIGAHGKAIPLVNEKTKEYYENILAETDERLISFLKTHGMTHKFAGENFKIFFEKLNSKSPQIIHACYPVKGFLGVNNISMSLPLKVRQGKVMSVAEISPNNVEKERFRHEAKELKNSVTHILETHKKLIEYK